MSSRREAQRLNDIAENIDAIEAYLADMDLAAFTADRKTVDATERCLERIAEAVVKIGPERMAQIAPAIPAGAVRGLGNVLRHEYDAISLPRIFQTVREDLPGLKRACLAALES